MTSIEITTTTKVLFVDAAPARMIVEAFNKEGWQIRFVWRWKIFCRRPLFKSWWHPIWLAFYVWWRKTSENCAIWTVKIWCAIRNRRAGARKEERWVWFFKGKIRLYWFLSSKFGNKLDFSSDFVSKNFWTQKFLENRFFKLNFYVYFK